MTAYGTIVDIHDNMNILGLVRPCICECRHLSVFFYNLCKVSACDGAERCGGSSCQHFRLKKYLSCYTFIRGMWHVVALLNNVFD